MTSIRGPLKFVRTTFREKDRKIAMAKKNAKWVVPLTIVAVLIVARLCLPLVLKWYVNKTLNRIPGYQGHLEDIDVHLWRGAYEIVKFDLKKIKGNAPVPFFSVESADLSIQWKELFHGALVGKIVMVNPQLNFVVGATPDKKQTEIDGSWQDRVKELLPFKINYFGIKNGSIHFRNPDASPPVDIYLDQVESAAENLSNSRNETNRLPARVEATGQPMHHGVFHLRLLFNPFSAKPTFDVEARVEEFDVTTINSFFEEYGGLKVERGVANVFAECVSDDGSYKGYVKPFISDLRFKGPGDKALTFGQKVKGALANFLAFIFENREKNSVATRVEFSGELEDAEVRTWAAIRSAFRHAFIEALPERLEHSLKKRGRSNIKSLNPQKF